MRHARLIVAILLGFACVALVLLWWRSYTTSDRLEGWWWDGTPVMVISKQGGVILFSFDTKDGPVDWTWGIKSPAVDHFTTFPQGDTPESTNGAGFGQLTRGFYIVSPPIDQGNGMVMGGEAYQLSGGGPILPHWLLVLLTAGLAALACWRGKYSLRSLLIAITVLAICLAAYRMMVAGDPEPEAVPLP